MMVANPVSGLSTAEIELIRQCLEAASNGGFFPDWEFETLFGISREEVKKVCEQWPNVVQSELSAAAVVGSLNNLLGYPHRKDDELFRKISSSPESLIRLLEKLEALGW